jgi:PmbA protein
MNIEAAIDKATRAQWELYTQRSRTTDIQMRQSSLEATIKQEKMGYGVRVIIPRNDGAGVGFASCNSEQEIEATARKAHDLARMNRSPFFELPGKKKYATAQTVDSKIMRDEDASARDYAEATQSLISNEKEISLTFGKVRTYAVQTEILNNRGLSCTSKGTYIYLEMTLKIGAGANPTEFWPTQYARRISDVAPNKLIPQWLTVAKSCLKRHPPKTQNTTVVFAPGIVCDVFVPTIGFHASAEAVKLNLSHFKKGAKVGAEQMTLTDDGLYPYGLRTNPFDDEGYPQQRTKVIERGVFRNYLYDQQHSQTLKAKPTGNGIRPRSFGTDVDEKYEVLPDNTNTNFYFKPGNQSLESLIADIKDGILINQAAWLNPDEITTRFGSEIRNAQEIKNGELGEGIVGGTVSGSAFELMHKVSGISNRPEIISGYAFGCVSPYMRFDDVQISGPT